MSEQQSKPRRARARSPEVRAPEIRELESEESASSEEGASAVVRPASTSPSASPSDRPSLLHRVQLDPATGLALFVPGLFVMAVGGAATWHWIFNAGEAVMMLGMTYFVVAVALTALQQRSSGKRPGGPSPSDPGLTQS